MSNEMTFQETFNKLGLTSAILLWEDRFLSGEPFPLLPLDQLVEIINDQSIKEELKGLALMKTQESQEGDFQKWFDILEKASMPKLKAIAFERLCRLAQDFDQSCDLISHPDCPENLKKSILNQLLEKITLLKEYLKIYRLIESGDERESLLSAIKTKISESNILDEFEHFSDLYDELKISFSLESRELNEEDEDSDEEDSDDKDVATTLIDKVFRESLSFDELANLFECCWENNDFKLQKVVTEKMIASGEGTIDQWLDAFTKTMGDGIENLILSHFEKIMPSFENLFKLCERALEVDDESLKKFVLRIIESNLFQNFPFDDLYKIYELAYGEDEEDIQVAIVTKMIEINKGISLEQWLKVYESSLNPYIYEPINSILEDLDCSDFDKWHKFYEWAEDDETVQEIVLEKMVVLEGSFEQWDKIHSNADEESIKALALKGLATIEGHFEAWLDIYAGADEDSDSETIAKDKLLSFVDPQLH